MHLKHTVYSYACNIKCINEEAENGVEEDHIEALLKGKGGNKKILLMLDGYDEYSKQIF